MTDEPADKQETEPTRADRRRAERKAAPKKKAPAPDTRIRAIFAYVTRDAQDDVEGILSFMKETPQGRQWVPMVAADEERRDALRPIAERIMLDTGRPVYLIEMTKRRTLAMFRPGSHAAGEQPVHVVKGVREVQVDVEVQKNGQASPTQRKEAADGGGTAE